MDEDNNNYTEGEDNLEMEAGDIELPSPDLEELASMLDEDSPPNTEELGVMDEDNNNNYTEGEDNVEMEAGDIELPSPDLEELASMLDELGLMDKDNNNY